MKEYGGYIELDNYEGIEYHRNALGLNCGRNGLKYLFLAKKIKKIFLPYYLCSSIRELCISNKIEIDYYHITSDFKPIFYQSLISGEYIYIVNYWGQLSNDHINNLYNIYKNVIIDNSQAFFQMPVDGVDTIYSCRKFFGVPDGAYLYTDKAVDYSLEQDISYDRMNFLLGRYEKTANEFYNEYVKNNEVFISEDLKTMSRLTHNLLRAINYKKVKKKRRENMAYLHKELKALNCLEIEVVDGGFMYPLYLERAGEIRKRLQRINIYIPVLWNDVLEICPEGLEAEYVNNILPLPIDQRYGREDMRFIIDAVLNTIN